MKIKELPLTKEIPAFLIADEVDKLVNLITQFGEVGAMEDYVADFLCELIFQKFGNLLLK